MRSVNSVDEKKAEMRTGQWGKHTTTKHSPTKNFEGKGGL